MKNCPNCGAALPEDGKACPVCGYVLQQKIPRGDLTKQTPSPEPETDLLGEEKAVTSKSPDTDATATVATSATEETAEMPETPETPETPTAENVLKESVTSTQGVAAAAANEPEKISQTDEAAGVTPPTPTPEAQNAELATADSEISEPTFNQPGRDKSVLEAEPQPAKSQLTDSLANAESVAKASGTKAATKKPELTVLPGGRQAVVDEEEEAPTPGDYLLDYFRFLNRQILSPNFNQSGPTAKEEKWYGVASFLIIVLSNGFALSRLLTVLIYRVLGLIQSFGLQFQYRGSSLLFFFELSLYLAVAGTVYLLAYYLVAGKLFGRPLQFLQALGELMAPASLAVYLSLAAVVLALLLSGTPSVTLTMVVASLLLLAVSFIGNLWQTPNLSARFNRFYTILLTILACLLVLVLVSRFFLTGMLQDLPIQQVPTGIQDLFGESDLFY